MTAFSTIDEISVHGHMGRTDLTLRLGPDVTLIHGANGTLKTTILHYLANIANFDLVALQATDFTEIRLQLSSAQELRLTKLREDHAHGRSTQIRFELDGDELFVIPSGFEVDDVLPQIQGFYESTDLRPPTYLPAFRTLLEAAGGHPRAALGYGSDQVSDRQLSRRLHEFERAKHQSLRRQQHTARNPRYYRSIESSVNKTLFARMYFGDSVPIIGYPTLFEVERQLRDAVNDAKFSVAAHEREFLIQAIDQIATSAFEPRESSGIDPKTVTSELLDIRDRLRKVVDSSGTLLEVRGTVDALYDQLKSQVAPPIGISIVAALVSALRNLFTRIDEAMAPLEDFENAVNRFLDGKKLTLADVSYQHGPVRAMRQAIVLNSGERIRLSSLSSGERHILSMLYCAEQHNESRGMFLIDEPEISLHVDWQRRILPEIMLRLTDTQVVVATHSPEVAAGFPDSLQVIDTVRRTSSPTETERSEDDLEDDQEV